MIDGIKYIETVKDYYSFLTTEYNLKLFNEKIRGNAFYDVQYIDKTKIISISYENIEDYFQVIIFKLQNGEMPDYDDKTKTMHLNKLTTAILAKVRKGDVITNNEYFSKFDAKDILEKKLLKSARELRICLRYFDGIESV